MGVRKIPAAFEQKCDGCGKVEQTASDSRPAHWCDLIIAQDAYDFQGAAVADGTVRRLLCQECKTTVADAINTAIRARTALSSIQSEVKL